MGQVITYTLVSMEGLFVSSIQHVPTVWSPGIGLLHHVLYCAVHTPLVGFNRKDITLEVF